MLRITCFKFGERKFISPNFLPIYTPHTYITPSTHTHTKQHWSSSLTPSCSLCLLMLYFNKKPMNVFFHFTCRHTFIFFSHNKCLPHIKNVADSGGFLYPKTHWDVDSLGVMTAGVEWDPGLRVWSFVLCKSDTEAKCFFSFGREKMPPALHTQGHTSPVFFPSSFLLPPMGNRQHRVWNGRTWCQLPLHLLQDVDPWPLSSLPQLPASVKRTSE